MHMLGFASALTNDAQACVLYFHLWRRYIPIAVYAAYAVAQLKGSVSVAGSATAIRERSFGAARWILQRFKSNRGSELNSAAEMSMKQSLM